MSGKPGVVPPWRNLWQQYPCELCLAGPGDPCRTYSGNVKFEPHAARATIARAFGWRREADHE